MNRPYPFLRWWLLPFVRSRIWTIRGLENLPTGGGFIIAPNHQSWADSALIAAAVYRRLQKELRFVSQSSRYRFLGALNIPSNDRSRVLDAAMEALQAGHPVVIFPEGNSNKLKHLREPKTGVARLALRTGLPVIPVGIRGSHGVSMLGALAWFFSLWRPLHIRFGQPISFPLKELTGDDDALLHQTAGTVIQAISQLSGKPLPDPGVQTPSGGWLWFFAWRIFRPLVQWRVRVHGARYLPEHGPFIVAANHGSYFDAPSLSMAVFHATGLQLQYPTKQTVAQTFAKYGGRGLLQVLGMVPLDNADRSKVLEPAIHELRQGGVVGIFPEGTRNKPTVNPNWATEHLRGKTGAARLVIATGAPIIPAGIRAPIGWTLWSAVLDFLQFWKFIHITFGPPVVFSSQPSSLESTTREDLDRLTREIMQSIAGLTGLRYPH